MITLIVKVDGRNKTQRISIPKLILKIMRWEEMAIYKMRIQDNNTVTIEGYLTNEDIKK